MTPYSVVSQPLNKKPDAVGLLGNFFALEVVHYIFMFLPIRSLWAYGNTSTFNRLCIQEFIRLSINDELRPFCEDPVALQAVIWKTRSIISGSVALAVLMPFHLRKWDPTDMDIYVTSRALKRVIRHLERREGYRVAAERTQPNIPNLYKHTGSIKEVIKLVKDNGRKIDIILSNKESALTPIFCFYGTHVMNAITGRGLFCVYPNRTLSQKVVLNAHSSMGNPHVQGCIVKYTKRGFCFGINAIVGLNAPHYCTLSRGCPHTYRSLFDKGVLVFSTHKAAIRTKFLSNNMAVAFNGRHTNGWILGGDPCDVETELPLTALPLMIEVALDD